MRTVLAGAVSVACAVALVAAVPPGDALAAGYSAAGISAAVPTASKKVVTSYLKGDPGNSRTYLSTRKVTDVKSSDPKVVSVKAQGGYGFAVRVRKAGKAKVTYRIGGAKKVLSYAVRKYANPVRSFKLGSKDYAAKLKGRKSYALPKERRDLGKVSVRPARGWRLKRIYTGFSARNALTMRNGARIGGALNVCAVLVHGASGLVETVEVRNG